ncbi:MAG: hypothetical protein Q7V04_12210 [Deltaproteobacteria bacterium]|nr:hypothetical protein [Deltaproteobacteria bacterium]
MSDKVAFKGSKQFTPFMIKDTFKDKTLNFMLDEGGDKEFGRSMNTIGETSYHLDLSTRDWFVFDDCFGTLEEKMLIQFVKYVVWGFPFYNDEQRDKEFTVAFASHLEQKP